MQALQHFVDPLFISYHISKCLAELAACHLHMLRVEVQTIEHAPIRSHKRHFYRVATH